jgi:hypothetical protein
MQLAERLRAGRSVRLAAQRLISDPTLGDVLVLSDALL